MKIIDISWPISTGMTSYKNSFNVLVESIKQFETHQVRESQLILNTHSGTHVDAPAHFIKNGYSIDQLELERLMGTCMVLDCTNIDHSITQADLEKYDNHITAHDIVLLKTKNSLHGPSDPFDPNFVYLNASGTSYLISKKIKAIGIDYLGIERAQPDHSTHTQFMNANIPVIEGLRLLDVMPGRYQFICLPLLITGAEAAPARAILIETNESVLF